MLGFRVRGTYWGYVRVTLELYGDNGKENGNYSDGLYRTNNP